MRHCLWHAWRGFLTAGAGTPVQDRFTAVPEFLMDLKPAAGNPSGVPAASVRESDRFRGQLTESQLSQRNWYPGNPENATTPIRNPLL